MPTTYSRTSVPKFVWSALLRWGAHYNLRGR